MRFTARRRYSEAGFTLMELIGVLAILGILSGMMAPSLFDAINDAYSTAEEGNIEQMGQDLIRHISTTGTIPGRQRNRWTAAIASVSQNRIELIERNKKGFRRALYFDPQFFTSTESNFNGYTQTDGLLNAPVSPRVMIISDMTRNVPNLPATSSVFDAIWDQDPGARYIESEDIKVQRLHLGHLFHRVLFTNAKNAQPGYALENQSTSAVPAASGAVSGVAERYVLEGTKIRLFSDPFPAGATLDSVLITEQSGFDYRDNGTFWHWSRQ